MIKNNKLIVLLSLLALGAGANYSTEISQGISHAAVLVYGEKEEVNYVYRDALIITEGVIDQYTGETISLEMLQETLKRIEGHAYPMYIDHDIENHGFGSAAAHMSNFRVVEKDGLHYLVGDIKLDKSREGDTEFESLQSMLEDPIPFFGLSLVGSMLPDREGGPTIVQLLVSIDFVYYPALNYRMFLNQPEHPSYKEWKKNLEHLRELYKKKRDRAALGVSG